MYWRDYKKLPHWTQTTLISKHFYGKVNIFL
jgi:hypothetical protein